MNLIFFLLPKVFLSRFPIKNVHIRLFSWILSSALNPCQELTLQKKSIPQIQTRRLFFISQHLKYASSVYETNHVYFVYKQQMAEYLPKALSAACQKIYNLREQYFCFSYHSRDYRILRSDVLYMERKLRNTEIHTKSQIYYCCEKIQDLLEQLKPDFCICHKSFAVNINAIHTFSHAGIELSDGTHLPVSRNCYQSTKDSFAQLLLKN